MHKNMYGASRTRRQGWPPRSIASATLQYGEQVAYRSIKPDTASMSNVTREEVNARLEASEAKVATVVEGLRADAATLRAEVQTGLAEIRAQGDRAQASAEKFYADAGRLLAEIRLAGEQNKTNFMAMGYKVAAWTFGAIIALASVSLAIYKAVNAAVS